MDLGLSFGQGPTLVGSGYSDPSLIQVAPGQITTLFVTGLGSIFFSNVPVGAETLPLPTTLAGISVLLSHNGRPPSAIPLIAVQQISMCRLGDGSPAPPADFMPGCLVTAITVQIPFDLTSPLWGPPDSIAELAVKANGHTSRKFKLQPVSTNLHILNGLDNPHILNGFGALPAGNTNTSGSVVTHGDGSAVTALSPAKAGETVVIYAFGLGTTSPAVTTGDITPLSSAPSVDATVAVQFDFRPNASPSSPYVSPDDHADYRPAFVGLTPGQVGVYQINVKIPDTIPAVPPCSLARGVASNLTIDIGASEEFGGRPPSVDGAPICVQPE